MALICWSYNRVEREANSGACGFRLYILKDNDIIILNVVSGCAFLDSRVIVLVYLLSILYLYEINLNGTQVQFVEFIKYFYSYLLLPLVIHYTIIPCIHSFSHPSCSTLPHFPCVQVLWCCNFLPCVCHVHVSRYIYLNVQALADEVFLGKILRIE